MSLKGSVSLSPSLVRSCSRNLWTTNSYQQRLLPKKSGIQVSCLTTQKLTPWLSSSQRAPLRTDPKRSPPRNRPSVPRMDQRTFRVHYSQFKICMSSTWLWAMPQDSILLHIFPLHVFNFKKATEGYRGQPCYEQSKLPRCRIIAPSWDFTTISKDFMSFSHCSTGFN